ncbi:MAG: hypothetical protein KW788_04800 [Candidatus Doudnabacteria bacterium]|nr:hypothetical protein [Candidatus Doudnabacteria bacterium]
MNSLPANKELKGETCMSPRMVLQKKTAHCAEGALLAAAIFMYHGRKPYLLDLRSTKHDQDHVVALFKENGHWGAVSKTNHAVLRFREPVYRTVRELAMSYFHEYFLDNGHKTLREFSRPFNLAAYDESWITADFDLWSIMDDLDASPHFPIVSLPMLKKLRRADKIEIQAGLIKEW